jgi:hypothetical protein
MVSRRAGAQRAIFKDFDFLAAENAKNLPTLASVW